jgi:CRP-like cAMP-binding protein
MCVTYQKDDAVINQGDQFQRIFQLSRGSCRIEKMDDSGQRMVLGRMVPDDGAVFGEISFLEGGAASASVIADENDTQVFVIEGYFLNVLFEKYPSMGGRFYHFLAQMLSKRLKQRESEQQPGGAKEKSKEKKKKRGSAQPGSKSGEKHAELSEQNESGTENTSTAEQSN